MTPLALLAVRSGLSAGLAASLIGFVLAGCAGTGHPRQSPADAEAAARGRAFVARACAGCHATLADGASTDPAAPPFRYLATHRPRERLAADLAAVARHGHVQMPPIYMTDTEQADVLAYMAALRLRALPKT